MPGLLNETPTVEAGAKIVSREPQTHLSVGLVRTSEGSTSWTGVQLSSLAWVLQQHMVWWSQMDSTTYS